MKNTRILETVTTMLSTAAVAENGAGVIYEGGKTTYRELDDLSRRAAAGLQSPPRPAAWREGPCQPR